MHIQEYFLRLLPKVDALLAHTRFATYQSQILKPIVQQHIDSVRQEILTQYNVESPLDSKHIQHTIDTLIESIDKAYKDAITPSLMPVVNATGVVLQTNLGRSVFSPSVVQDTIPLLTRYNTLEYDIVQGKRSSRYTHSNALLKALFSYEYEFLLVNNNAAAVLLILNTFAKDKEVVVSRGELIEIGGEFRIPEVMKSAGSFLREVGATNKTHLKDYQEAITPNTAILMKAHKSNFAQIGFCAEVSINELSTLAKAHNLIDYYDLGSGYAQNLPFIDSATHTLKEPSLKEIFTNPPSLLSFSGDKLFGASQVGIIAGKPTLIATLKKNQLLRALRVDKLCISFLQATLQAYIHNDLEQIPTLRMLSLTSSELCVRANEFLKTLKTQKWHHLTFKLIELDSLAGGGSLPDTTFKSFGIALCSAILDASTLHSHLRTHYIIARILKQYVVLDMRTLLEGDLERIIQALHIIDAAEQDNAR